MGRGLGPGETLFIKKLKFRLVLRAFLLHPDGLKFF